MTKPLQIASSAVVLSDTFDAEVALRVGPVTFPFRELIDISGHIGDIGIAKYRRIARG